MIFFLLTKLNTDVLKVSVLNQKVALNVARRQSLEALIFFYNLGITRSLFISKDESSWKIIPNDLEFRVTRVRVEFLKLTLWSYPVCCLSPEGWQPRLPLFPTHHCQLNSRVCSSGSRLDLCWWLCTAIEFSLDSEGCVLLTNEFISSKTERCEVLIMNNLAF